MAERRGAVTNPVNELPGGISGKPEERSGRRRWARHSPLPAGERARGVRGRLILGEADPSPQPLSVRFGVRGGKKPEAPARERQPFTPKPG
jgi:hypothetical protein